jgi:hypothetical protein
MPAVQTTQLPLWQVAHVPQRFPHAPQLFESDVSSTQLFEHALSPTGQATQPPFRHSAAAPQTLPHAPQLFGSVCSFAQPPSHAVSPAAQGQSPLGQTQVPAWQIASGAHW